MNLFFTLSALTHLDDVVHVRQETVQAHFQQHDESSAHILPHFWLLVCRQCKQVLQKGEAEGQKDSTFSSHPLKCVKHDATGKKGKMTELNEITL